MKNKRIERITFQAIVFGEKDKNTIIKKANHERFKRNLFTVGDVNRMEINFGSDFSVFTVVNVYNTDSLSFLQYLFHCVCKLRAAALRYMGVSEFVIVIIR